MFTRFCSRSALRTASLVLTATVAAVAADAPKLPTKAEVEALITQGQAWVLAQQQPSGAFVPGDKFVLGITAMAVDTLATPPLAVAADKLAKSIDAVKSYKQPDGGIYAPEEGLGNYGTSLALMAFSAVKLKDEALIKGAQDYLFGIQNSTKDSIANGGIGYGSKGAGHEDLSNTTMAIKALRASGVPANDPHMQAALAFIGRCQNLSSTNQLPWVGGDGGAVYSPDESKAGGSFDGKEPKAGEPAPKLHSYGSMTYALISSYIALDVKSDDPRVTAALGWAKQNYTFDANPGMAAGKEREGLFYYYLMAARTYDLVDSQGFALADGKAVDWRADLFAAISQRAQISKLADGTAAASWINDAKRWGEGMPQLPTLYVLRSLKHLHASL